MKKRILSVFVAVVMLFTIVPLGSITVSAAYENTYSNTGNQRADIVGVALTQIGYREGTNNDTKYGDWYGLPNQPWCAMFVSWCARQANIPTSVLKNSAVAAPDSGYFNIPYYSGSSYTPKPGDLFFTTSFSHVGLVYYVDGDYFYTIEGNSNNSGSSEGIGVFSLRRKINNFYFGVPNYGDGPTPHTHSYDTFVWYESAHPHYNCYKCSCGDVQRRTSETRAYSACSTCMKLSWAYVQPVKAYTINTGKTTVYDNIEGTAKSNKIYDTDLCTISEIYDCGWCKVTFPLDAGGTDTGYVKISVFMKSGGFISYASKQINTYSRSDLKTSIGYAAADDKLYILGTAASAVQIAYPLSAGGYKVGWVPSSSITATLKYNANGGSGTMSNASVKYKGDIALASNKFTRTGYTFVGWNVYRSSDKTWYVSSEGWKTSNQITSNGYEKKLYKNGWSGTLDQPWLSLGKTNDTFTFYAVWEKSTLTKLEIKSKPTKTTYYIGDSLNTSGLTLKATYSDGSTSTVSSGFTTSGFSSTTAGTKTVTVSYGGKTTTFTVTVNTPTISLSSSSETLDIGDTVTLTATTTPSGQTVTWTSSNTSVATVSNGTVTAKSNGTATITAKFTYNGTTYSKTCAVTVRPATLSSIVISNNPTKTTYYIGDSLNTSGLTLKATYSDGTTATITSGFTVSGFESDTAGTKTVTVSYGGKTTTFTVEVKQKVIDNAFTVVIGSDKETVSVGGTVKVTLTPKNFAFSEGLCSFDCPKLYFDSNALEFVGATVNNSNFVVGANEREAGCLSIIVTDNSLAGASFGDGECYVTLEFKALVEGMTTISLQGDDIISGTVANDELSPCIGVAGSDFEIEISAILKGDVTGDGLINSTDFMWIRRYYLGLFPLNDAQKEAADVTGDGLVNSTDFTRIRRHYLGLFDLFA